MRLVKISDLSEEERKKALEAQQARLEANRQASEQQRQNANDRFNELVTKTGGYDTSKHTTTMNKVMKAMKKSGASNEKISTFKKANHLTLWDSVLDTMNGLGKIGENTWLGLKNGLKSFQQNIGTQTSEIQSQRADFVHFIDNETMEKLKNNEITEEELKQAENKNNSIIPTGDDIRKENEENIKKFQDEKQKNIEKINKNVEEIDNPILKKVAEVSPSIGQMIPSFIPGAGAVYATGSATGQYYDDAKQRGMTEEEANNYAGIMGLIEGGTEMIGIKNLSKAGKGIKTFVAGTGKEVAKETSEKVSKSVLKQSLKDYGIGIADNVMQEALIDPIDEVVSYGISGETKHDYSTSEGWKELGNDMLQDGINGGLVSAILGGANLGIQSCTGVVQKYRNGENITNEEFKNAVKDAGKKLDVSKMVISGVEQQVSKYKDYYSNKPVDNETQNWLNQAENIINNNTETNTNNNQTVDNNINTSSMSFENSAKAYNIDTNNETVKTVNQVLSNRNITGRFDESYFKNNNENAIWRTYTDEQGNTKREVIFNPNGNTQDTMQQISIHELTHDLSGTKEFDELKSLVLDRNKTMQGYTEARQSLENTYSQVYDPNSKEFKNLVDEEEVADTLAQKLGDQEFVNSLSTEKPTVFKKIYDWVVDKVNKITGNKIEKVYWEDIRNKFENAYRQTYQGESNQTRYSFVGEKGLNNAIMQEPGTYMTVEQGLNRAKQMQKTGTDNENIRQNTGWFQDRNGDWKFEISDKNMKIKDNIQLKENTNYKLGDIIEHNTLFTMYPNFKNIDINFKDLKNVNGFYDKKQKSITINNKIINSGINLEKTIIHELQHSIQNEEGFENGTTSRLSRKRYYENLGEIEASDTAQRFLKEKYENSSNSTAPESSKANPKHKNYDRYMQKRGIVDKIKDNMFKSNKKGDKSYETFEENISENQTQDNNLVVGRERGRYLNETNQKSLEQINKETLRDNDQQIWNGLKNTQTDNRGRKLSKQQQEYFKDSKIRDENGNLQTVYHTTTNDGEQFNIFDPRNTDFYRFGNQIVNYYTDSKAMSGSYADGSYEMAETSKNISNTRKAKRQYEGYINITDPYIVDAEGNNWNQVKTDVNEYGKKLLNEIDVLEKNNIYGELRQIYDNVERTSREASDRFYKIQKKAGLEQYDILGEYARWGNIDNIYENGLFNEQGKAAIANHINDTIDGKTLKEIGLDLFNNKYETLLSKEIDKLKKQYPDIKDIPLEDFDIIAEHYDEGKAYIENRYRNQETTNDIVKKVIDLNNNGAKYDGVIIKNVRDYGGGEVENYNPANVYVTFNSIQFKNADNVTPTSNEDIRYSTENKGKWQEFLDTQIGQRGKGKTVQELKLPTKETVNNKKVDSYNVLYQDNEQTSTMNLPVSEGGKVRKHYKTIMQSSNTSPEAKAIAQELMGTDTYVPDSNERQLKIADERIERNGADNEAVSLATKVRNGDRITAEDIATGERLIEYYSKIGDKEKLQDSIQNVALAGTQLGQAVQAMSLVNRQTPQGQAVYLQKVVDKMNSEIDRRTKGKGKKFELTPEMIEKITNSSKENLEQNIDEVARELANQVPKTTIEKIDSWRYFSMLANPRTHFRNIIGNFSMAGVQSIKNKVAGGLEAVAQKTGMIDKRTKTLKPANKQTRDFAKADVDNVMARLNNESKFDARNLIQQYQRTFKNNALENTLGKLYNLNSKALEKEDVFGLKRGYRKALADYMTANKLTKEYLTSGTREADIQLEKARKYAIEQAQEATFHQQSAMASMLAQFEKKNTVTRLITGAVIPFKKTPINVAKSGASYSPLGLVKSFTLDVVNLKNGKITANQYIDNLAKGLTGTGIATVGYALAQAGILTASGGDDDQKNQYYKEDRGNQAFALKIGEKTYSLDWLAPTAIPLFIGAELNYNIKNSNEEQTPEDILDRVSNSIDAMSSAMNPMIEMSMLSGLASTIKSFSQGDTQVFQNLAINAGKSYVNQFFPTLGGQIARIVDDTERSSTSTKKNAFAKAVDSTGKQILNKIPFASKLLPAKTDVWGNTLKRDSNPFYRALQQMAFPWSEKELKSTSVDNAISDLYEETGEKSVLPNTSINKDFTLNGEKYRLTAEEYAEYKKNYGKNSYKLLNNLTSSKEYKNMNNEQKIEAISKIYEYANEKNKVDYANKNKVDIETSSLYNTVTSIEKEGGSGSDYFKYLGQIKGIEKTEEKIKILESTDIPEKSKSSIYENTIGKSDDFYSTVLKESNININEYLKYKQQKFESDKKDDGTLEGKTITNSKKQKVYNYVNNMNINYNQKLLILGKQYKLKDNEQKKLYEYINNLPGQTSQEKLEIFKMYTNNFQIYKNGTMSFK